MRDTELTNDPNGIPHRQINPETGMQAAYVVLSEEERQKGFVRPVRRTYIHVGIRPKHELRDLTNEEKERYDKYGYIKFEEYPDSDGAGKFWTKEELNSGCNQTTTMGQSLAETYAVDPKFYGATFCASCRKHFPVGEKGQFIWEETGEKVGT